MAAAAEHLRQVVGAAGVDQRDVRRQPAQQERPQARIGGQLQELRRVADFQQGGVDVDLILRRFREG
jgi:hypothetical protein